MHAGLTKSPERRVGSPNRGRRVHILWHPQASRSATGATDIIQGRGSGMVRPPPEIAKPTSGQAPATAPGLFRIIGWQPKRSCKMC